jgi:hypothetical protein
VDSLKALDPNRPIREADILSLCPFMSCQLNRSTQHLRSAYQTLAKSLSGSSAGSDAKAPLSRTQWALDDIFRS